MGVLRIPSVRSSFPVTCFVTPLPSLHGGSLGCRLVHSSLHSITRGGFIIPKHRVKMDKNHKTTIERLHPSMIIPPGNVPRRLPQVVETFLLINIVPFLWGSYAPAVKFLTKLDHPMPLTLANLLTTIAAAAGLTAMRYLQPSSSSKKPSFATSAELGGYIFVGAWLHLRSVALTTASRSAFFIQFTTLFVPVLEALLGKKVPLSVIPACALTLVGAFFLVLPSDLGVHANAVSTIFASFNPGDVVAILSALCYRCVKCFFKRFLVIFLLSFLEHQLCTNFFIIDVL